jgi:hypothetical protein
MTGYKAHLYQSLGNGKLNPSVSQCGRKLYRNERGTHLVKTKEFIALYNGSHDNCCDKCVEYAKAHGKIKE